MVTLTDDQKKNMRDFKAKATEVGQLIADLRTSGLDVSEPEYTFQEMHLHGTTRTNSILLSVQVEAFACITDADFEAEA